MTKCIYQTEYFDIQNNITTSFQCQEEAFKSNLCQFHDKDYASLHESEILTLLQEKMNKAISTNEPLYCIGFHLSEINLSNVQTQNTIYFSHSQIEKIIMNSFYLGTNLVFEEAVIQEFIVENIQFNWLIDFKKTKFGKAKFNKVLFQQPVDFSSCEFQEVEFTDVRFGDSNFMGSRFNKITKFSECSFRNANFKESKFNQSSDFSEVTFEKKSDFSESIFLGKVNFVRSVFQNESNFQNANFVEASFNESQFAGKIDFSESVFAGKSSFNKTVFGGTAWFFNCNFDTVHFNGSVFNDFLIFWDTNFKEEADFSWCTFGDMDLEECTFEKEVRFFNATFKNKAKFGSTFKDVVYFRDTLFEKQEYVTFSGDLSQISFLGTDITRVRFSDGVQWAGGGLLKVVEEVTIESSLENKEPSRTKINILTNSLTAITSIYRNLRENYEYRLRYEEAGKFFIREMELKRNYKEINLKDFHIIIKKSWFVRNFSFSGLYYHLARYGESYVKPAGFTVVLITLSIMYFWYESLSNPTNMNYQSLIPTLEDSIKRSLSAFFPIFQLEKNELGDYLLRLAMFPILGTMFIALKRKLERRFRH